MKLNSKSIFVVFLVFALFPFASAWTDSGGAAQNVNGCGTMTSPSTVYTLTANVFGNGSVNCFDVIGSVANSVFNMAGFNITNNNTDHSSGEIGVNIVNAVNFTLNGQGGTIKGWGILDDNGRGIYLQGSAANNTIKNITVYNNSIGVEIILDAVTNTFNDVTISGNKNQGLNINSDDAKNNNFYDTHINDNLADGLYLTISFDNNFVRTEAFRNGNDGIVVGEDSTNNNFLDTKIKDNGRYGLFVDTAISNIFSNTNSTNNTQYGIYILDSPENEFTNTISSFNTLDGIYIITSDTNFFTETITNNNSAGGVLLNQAVDTAFVRLTANGNTQTGVLFDTTDDSLLFNLTTLNNNQGVVFTSATGNSIFNLVAYDNTVKEVGSANWGASTDNVLLYTDNGWMAGAYGQIRFAPLEDDMVGTIAYGLGQTAYISYNNIYFNTSKITSAGADWSATLSIYNLPTNMFNYQIYKDGVICSAPACQAVGPILVDGDGDAIFDVTGWSGYNIQGSLTGPGSCSALTKTAAYLIPGFMALIILIAGGLVLLKGFGELIDVGAILIGFVTIIIGLCLLPAVSQLVISTC